MGELRSPAESSSIQSFLCVLASLQLCVWQFCVKPFCVKPFCVKPFCVRQFRVKLFRCRVLTQSRRNHGTSGVLADRSPDVRIALYTSLNVPQL